MKLVKAKDVVTRPKDGPVTIMINKVKAEHPNLLTYQEAAQVVGVHMDTLRRLCKSNQVEAPSLAFEQGRMTIYFFTEEDMAEVSNYILQKHDKGEMKENR